MREIDESNRTPEELIAHLLTRISCTDPQKQVAVASFSVDQPSLERLVIGKPWSLKGVMAACIDDSN